MDGLLFDTEVLYQEAIQLAATQPQRVSKLVLVATAIIAVSWWLGAPVEMVREVAAAGRLPVVNFAAETHVDRSIDGPRAFVETNLGATEDDPRVRHVRALVESAADASESTAQIRPRSPPRATSTS